MARLRRIDNVVQTRLDWRDAFTQFLEYKRVGGISSQTQSDYERTVDLLFKRFPGAWATDTALKEAAYAHLAQEGIAPATFNNRLVYLRTFFKWCEENGIIGANPLANVKKRKAESRIVAVEKDILTALLNAPDQSTFVGLRDYALILLTLDTGIRPKEAHTLIPVDFNAGAREIYISAKNAKTRVSRTLPVSDVTVKAIRRLIAVRPSEWGANVPIFCTYEGRPLNRNTWGDRMEYYSGLVGQHIRPYDLRHVFALEFLRHGASAFAVQRTLGHTTMEMTKTYIALANDDLKVAHAQSSPLTSLISDKKRVGRV